MSTMLTSTHAGLLVGLGRQIELGSYPNLTPQLRNLTNGEPFYFDNLTDILNSLSDEDVVFFFKGVVIFEKLKGPHYNSTTPTAQVFDNIKERMPERRNELEDWAFRNRGNEYTPLGHVMGRETQYEDEGGQQLDNTRRAKGRLEEELDVYLYECARAEAFENPWPPMPNSVANATKIKTEEELQSFVNGHKAFRDYLADIKEGDLLLRTPRS